MFPDVSCIAGTQTVDRSSLQNPDPKRFLEELESLLWTKDGWKNNKTN